ncbi:MOSC domain-containing protein [Roseovarius sp. SCSIO 43702]|uniref:MOSC domain-containing protein n=1 Tax=Roseovarius sp. SCSIO 43702 TaxID=2823043 RepID=UPI001C72C3A0|nr:MOSC domain-containing protein [Roseovarius sp. SCSIO 43702]QYX55270.1 MOSC domain-containing protein [Roseovarius sp. SCSIO 43702]
MWHGELVAIHIAEKGRAPMQPLEQATLIAGVGIEGDRYATGRGHYSDFPDIREITLIEEETLIALARDHETSLSTDEHRRNLTTRGVPLNHLVGRRFRVGETMLEGGRLNTPCRYLDLVTGKSVNDLLIHRSGLNARIVEGGVIRPGDRISPA